MRPASRATILILATLTIPFALFLWWTEADLRPRLERELEASLERQARLVQTSIKDQAFSDSLADAYGEASGSRITFIDRAGVVIGDSEVGLDRLPLVENHATRPEVAAALSGSVGTAIRPSETVSLRLLYVALPDPRGVLRVSAPLARADALVTRSRQWVLAGGLVTLLLMALLGRRLAGFWSRPVTRIQDTLAALGRGEAGRRAAFEGGGALASIGRSVDEAATRIEERTAGLSREAADLTGMFNELQDGVAQVDREGVIVRANSAFESWIGRSNLTGERIRSLFRDPANLAAVRAALAGDAATNESTHGSRTLLLSAHPDSRGALVVLRDLTLTRRLEGVRRDFVANVSHELKTPLTNVLGFAEAIYENDEVPEGPRGFANRIVVNSRRMQALVDDLLDLSRIESGAWTPEPMTLDLAAVARDVWTTFDRRPEETGVDLALEVPVDLKVQADPNALRQILRNLLDNALRYGPPGTSVTVSAAPEKGGVRIVVADAGSGIPTDHLERVFERFYRVDAARSREAGGTGLGLSIVKHLVAAHGGDIGIESEVGEGTRVWFLLPADNSA
ncbi:MAG: ATP-binding protein [Candidatus Palauibacterales bacterium]|nr:ATP-binding protein [Candidatus Palauibacterales bacterium]MDP2482463.1 ATP-binding protein [Candidatus Palauibacterales bacterium]